MPIRRLTLALAVVAGLLFALSGPGVRAGLWPFPTGFLLLRYGAFAGVAAALAALVQLASARLRGGHLSLLIAALIVGAASAVVPWLWLQRARSAPPIHDVTTDPSDPPPFVAVLPLRAEAPNPAAYGGADVAAAQARGYPDIRPVELASAPAAALAQARAAAAAMGWTIVVVDTAAGRLEATATTGWFGFKDDIVVRVRPAAGGSRVDVRSVSRVGGSDVGTNARRIRAFVARLRG